MESQVSKTKTKSLEVRKADIFLLLAFAGPLIASQLFFTGENLSSFKTVQYVYLVVGLIGISLAILFAVVNFPEVRQGLLEFSSF